MNSNNQEKFWKFCLYLEYLIIISTAVVLLICVMVMSDFNDQGINKEFLNERIFVSIGGHESLILVLGICITCVPISILFATRYMNIGKRNRFIKREERNISSILGIMASIFLFGISYAEVPSIGDYNELTTKTLEEKFPDVSEDVDYLYHSSNYLALNEAFIRSNREIDHMVFKVVPSETTKINITISERYNDFAPIPFHRITGEGYQYAYDSNDWKSEYEYLDNQLDANHPLSLGDAVQYRPYSDFNSMYGLYKIDGDILSKAKMISINGRIDGAKGNCFQIYPEIITNESTTGSQFLDPISPKCIPLDSPDRNYENFFTVLVHQSDLNNAKIIKLNVVPVKETITDKWGVSQLHLRSDNLTGGSHFDWNRCIEGFHKGNPDRVMHINSSRPDLLVEGSCKPPEGVILE